MSDYIDLALARLRAPISVRCDGRRYWITGPGEPVNEEYTPGDAKRCYLRLLRQVRELESQ